MLEVGSHVKLQHFVTVKDLQNDQVKTLIERAIYFKNGGLIPHFTQPIYAVNMFLKIVQEHIVALKWLKGSLDYEQFHLIQQQVQ